MRRLTLIRHGETEWNAAGRFQGHSDVPLSATGHEQSKRLAAYVATFTPVDVVVSSPLARSLETARIVFPERVIDVDARLRELHFGDFEGHTRTTLERDPRWHAWVRDTFFQRTPGGEGYADLRSRVQDWFHDAQKNHKDAHVLAVTHSGTIQMLIATLLGVERPRWRKRVYIRHTGVSHILFRGDEAIVERVNDTRHLVAEGQDPFSE